MLHIKDKNLFVQQRGHNNFFTPDKKLAKIFGYKKNKLWTKIFYETYGITYPRNMDIMLKSDNIRGFLHESLVRSHLTPIYRHCDLKLIIPFGNSNISDTVGPKSILNKISKTRPKPPQYEIWCFCFLPNACQNKNLHLSI